MEVVIYAAAIVAACIFAVVSVLACWSVYPARGSTWQHEMRQQGCVCGWHWERWGRRYCRDDCPLHGLEARFRELTAAS